MLEFIRKINPAFAPSIVILMYILHLLWIFIINKNSESAAWIFMWITYSIPFWAIFSLLLWWIIFLFMKNYSQLLTKKNILVFSVLLFIVWFFPPLVTLLKNIFNIWLYGFISYFNPVIFVLILLMVLYKRDWVDNYFRLFIFSYFSIFILKFIPFSMIYEFDLYSTYYLFIIIWIILIFHNKS